MTEASRPSPEDLLARIRAEEEQSRRAKLKIFFGAAAGVGKTYAMLVEAHERKRAGADVVVGLVETHGRRETQVLIEGLEILPRHEIEYRGVRLTEFDLDAALARRPELVLLDELAHTNAPGSRHLKRWQDVEELLAAGIEVYTTLNVQHVESLIDVVEEITTTRIRETVPDAVLDRADVIELVDLPPDDLLQRLKEGKVYLPQQAEWARENFFKKGNLIALRELALRQTAQRVDAQMEFYRRTQGIAEPWAVRERILVCVGDPVRGVRLVRAAHRLASALKAEWLAVHVETPGQLRESRATRDHIMDVLGFAGEFGAETAVLSGLRVRDEIVAFARARNVSRIVVGRSRHSPWRELLTGSLASALIREALVDVWVLGEELDENAPSRPGPTPAPAVLDWRAYVGALLIVAASTLVAALMHGKFDLSNLVMVYLVGVVVAAIAFGRGPAIFASVLGVAVFDFSFVPPRFSFSVSDTQYAITFAVMLLVGVVIGTLTAQLREQLSSARQRERRTAALYRLSHELAGRSTARDVMGAAVDRITEVFGGRVAILLPDDGDRVGVAVGDVGLFGGGEHERAVAQWAYHHRQPAGLGTATLSASRGLHVPLVGTSQPLGVLSIQPADPQRLHDPERLKLLQAFASQTALALERCRLAEAAERANARAETERARSALLSSVSHDLRTPLAAITGAASNLRDDPGTLPPGTRRELADTIAEEAERLNRLIGDLLEMTRLESGALKVRKEWHSLEEIVGAALVRLETSLGDRPIRLSIPRDLPLVPLDDVLFERVVWNLVENADKYTPAGLAIDVSAVIADHTLRFEVADRGPGLPVGEEQRVFEKFYRGPATAHAAGVGLGLAICRGIVQAHGGRISAANRDGGGAVFSVWLPLEGDPPQVEREPLDRAKAEAP
jgi:two-component system sensor histidine kinase KdpD